jgi:two-component system response regulator DevR
MHQRKAALSMSKMASRTAVIVDEHPLWLDALQNLLEQLELSVVGRATDRATAERLVDEHRPDVVVADYSTLEGDDGTPAPDNALVRARLANPDVKCIVLSESDDPMERDRAFASGAAAYCVKRAEPDDLAAAIRQSFDHSIYFATGAPSAASVAAARNVEDDSAGLTKRETEILRLTAEGYSNSQLARMLWVTEQTVKFHLSNIYRKLEVSNRTEASRWAQRNGLLNADVAAA